MLARNVLIISDTPNLSLSCACVLRHAGFEVGTTLFADARRRLRGKTYDLIFLDMRIPYREIMKLLSFIRLLKIPPAQIVIMASADSRELRTKALQSGAGEYLLKPVEPAEMIRLAQRVTSSPHV